MKLLKRNTNRLGPITAESAMGLGALVSMRIRHRLALGVIGLCTWKNHAVNVLSKVSALGVERRA